MSTTFTYTQHLLTAGLTRDEAAMYEVLVKHGSLPASTAAKHAKVSRTLAYKVLADLQGRGLAEREDPTGAASTFTAAHPAKLREVAERQAKEAESAKLAIDGIINPMSSDFNLAVGKPGVEFYEGKAGVKAILNDSLTAKETILSYANLDSIYKFFPDINKEYSKSREKLDIHKRGLMPDTPENREKIAGYASSVTETKFIKSAHYDTIVQIYDNKISYLTLTDEHQVGIILHNKDIYNVQKAIFEHLWSITPA